MRFLDLSIFHLFKQAGDSSEELSKANKELQNEIKYRKKAEDALRESEEQYKTLIESSSDCICHIDLDSKFIYMNPGGVRLNQLESSEEILGKQCTVGLTEKYKALMEDALERAKKGENVRVEYKSTNPKGKKYWWSSIISPIRDNDGNVVSLVRISRDISEKKQIEAALQESEEKYRTLVESSKDCICDIDLDGNFVYMNPGGVEHNELENSDEIIGQSCMVGLDKKYKVLMEDALERAKKGEDVRLEYKSTNPHGRLFWWSSIIGPIRDKEGNVISLVRISRDISEKKRLENELKIQMKELEAFAYTVSHDLRSPLRAIDGFTAAVLEDYRPKLDSDGQRYLDLIAENARKMGQLIDDLLTFSRLGRKNVDKNTINMEKLARDVFHMVRDTYPERNIQFKVNKIPQAYGDKTLIPLVLSNLINNAIKFTKDKESAIIEIGSKDKDGQIIYYIKDNGVGFNMKYVDKLFGVFQRLHSQEEFEGTGIGLANVHRIIHRHGGKVWAEGKLNEGAIFYFTIPKKKR